MRSKRFYFVPVLLSFLFLFSPQYADSQFGFEYNDSIVVMRNSKPLELAWAGGLNYTQVSDFDYDFDGDMDLLLFDRSKDNIRVLIQENGMSGKYYRLAYNAKNKFPDDVKYRATMVDYDLDGRKDLFTYGIGGIKVYRNTGDAINGLQWQLAKDLVYTEYPGGPANLYVSSSDIPAYVDLDFDSDIDVLTFSLSGSHVEYHQNQSMELYGIPDSLVFVEKNECWGLFREDITSNNVILNDTNVPCVNGNITNPLRLSNPSNTGSEKKHSGSTMLAIDYDNSGVYDLVIGDVSYGNLVLVMNGGSAPNTNSPMISQDPSFPNTSIGVDVSIFPAAFYVDVDFDGIKDLIAAPNAKFVSENESSIWYYKNIGDNMNPLFSFEATNKFQGDMIEHGSGSIPVFFDENDDGLQDLIVANNFRYKPVLDKESTLALYRNTGTATNPEFTYIDYNYLNLDMETYGLRSVPAFGDLDDDGDEDLLLGIADGTLVYYENMSTGSGAVFAPPMIQYPDFNGNPVQVTQYAHPQIFDLNKDGLLDLIIGNKAGELVYYQNNGTPNTPMFELTNSTLGNVDVSTITPDGYAAPFFFRHNDTTHLFCGSVDGKFFYYDSIDNNISPGDTFNLVSDNYVGINVEAFSSFYLNDIDNDGNYNLFVGQDLGGLFHFEADPNSDAGLSELEFAPYIIIYPNPTSGVFAIESEEMITEIKVIDMKGSLLKSLKPDNMKTTIDMEMIPNGIYVVEIETDSGAVVHKRVVRN